MVHVVFSSSEKGCLRRALDMLRPGRPVYDRVLRKAGL